ncbi:four helix bundle protein [Reichenbachiella faecimaris]|uniref:Four helix bundle protein n=1 Tax=Reichenbachiella faecimaris TaxID=692418 RepID=A0A1W2G813_REIFA|nr:four helix bundle protein [Reichenbachiella faecimaris]SMD32426.1 four helix bundle protein [Reichenbachiella faecimaris]
MGFKFEKLDVWKKNIDLSIEIHNMTKKWPKEEIYVLTSQIKRASDSISLNLTEGSTGQSNAEFSRFLGYAIRSALEVVNCLYPGNGRELIDQREFDQFYDKLTDIVKMLQGLRNSLKWQKNLLTMDY